MNELSNLLGRPIHHATIGRILRRHHLRPHKCSYFLHIRDPLFFEKMMRIVSVYHGGLEYLFCLDECPNIQALSRNGPDVRRGDGSRQREFVYTRNGTVDLFSFLHVPTGKVKSYCRPQHDTATFIKVFAEHISAYPTHAQLHYICDNLSPHFNEEFCRAVAKWCEVCCPKDLSTGDKRRAWLESENKRIVVHFLPFHGSWLNQVEIWFGFVKRYVLDDGWFDSVAELIQALLGFTDTWNEHYSHPFKLTYTGDGLQEVVIRRFTRILKFTLDQTDSRFLADSLQLCARISKQYRDQVSEAAWNGFLNAFHESVPRIRAIIDAEPGPVRRPRAQKVLAEFMTEALPSMPCPKNMGGKAALTSETILL